VHHPSNQFFAQAEDVHSNSEVDSVCLIVRESRKCVYDACTCVYMCTCVCVCVCLCV